MKQATVIGMVVRQDGHNVTGARVSLLSRAANAAESNATVRSAGNGTFRITVTPFPPYEILIEQQGFVRVRRAVPGVAAGARVDLGKIILEPADGELVGRVVDPRGRGVPSLIDGFSAEERSVVPAQWTDQQGWFRIPGVVANDRVSLRIRVGRASTVWVGVPTGVGMVKLTYRPNAVYQHP